MKNKTAGGKAKGNSSSAPKSGTRPPEDVGVQTPARSNKTDCVVVAVGASAGGFEAFKDLLKPMPKNPGMAFVLIPHLDPKHESVMPELLGRSTPMQVLQVHDGMRVTEDCVYVIPPNCSMRIQDGILRLSERQAYGPPMPIDTFFRSVAEDCGSNAMGVILSGTASDGTLGVGAIKNEGGITFAQAPETARYNSMPNNAIASGHVDFVLPPSQIARELLRIRKHPFVAAPHDDKVDEEAAEKSSDLSQIFGLLRQVRKVDFSGYKRGTIRRRIQRRMALAQVDQLHDYLKVLEQNRQELEALHHDMLINVTSFFRDPEAFEALKEIVYPEILRGRQPAQPVRVWVPGCSTGEEAYSHAISLVEYVSKMRADVSMQVFGTDLSDSAIRAARIGVYQDAIAADVSPARLRRFFRKVEGGYEIGKSIRDMCVFATQNVFSDPPFSRMDVVSCRNVLIYMSPSLQRRVLPIFHYALKPRGFLMVGNTEGIVGPSAELFAAADKQHKIYSKKMVPSAAAFGPPREREETPISTVTPMNRAADEPAKAAIDLLREADRLLLTKYVPAAVVVNEQLDIMQIRGRVGRYLELPSGKATLNLLKMARSGMLFELQGAVEEAKRTGSTVRREKVRFEINEHLGAVTVEVIPFHAPLESQPTFLIVFEEGETEQRMETPAATPAVPADAKDKQIAQLKQELGATKEYLQAIIEALEASNEELQAANEEIQSGNEELQSTNEELQTSKEELESANEELNTVNDEMQHRNAELIQLNNDVINLLSSVNIPIVMLDAGLNIRRITPTSEEVLGIASFDVGRPWRHVRLKFDFPDLERQMLDVIESLQPRELLIKRGPKQGHRLRITPYRTMDNRIEGVVLVYMQQGGIQGASRRPKALGKR